MKDNPFVQLKFTRGEIQQLQKILDTYEGEKPSACNWMKKVINQQLEVNGINPTKLNRK